jgi:homogentisate 1,2-dioxygenase
MSAHGPDNTTFEKASNDELKPVKIPDTTLAFMFESTYLFKITDYARKNHVDHDYYKCWQTLKNNFDPNKK